LWSEPRLTILKIEQESTNRKLESIEKKVKVGMTCELINLYLKRDKDGASSWVKDIPDDITAAAENDETATFALLVRNRRSYDSRKSL
jgi:hypothetical protein